MRRRVLLVALVWAMLAAPVAAHATAGTGPLPVDDLAAALRDDPILVEPTLGTGDTAGVHDVLTKSIGSTNPHNVVKATLAGLMEQRSRKEFTALRQGTR